MTRRVLVFACAAAGALALPPAAAVAALPKAPVVISIAPKKLGVGDQLTIRGRNFVPGKFKNVVVFQRTRSRAVFMRADSATATTIKIRIDARLEPFLTQRGGKASFTRFQIRVLARRFGLAFTPTRLSPLIGPATGPTDAAGPAGDCDKDGIPNSQETDSDNDLIPDNVEVKYGLNPCNPDSDGDGMIDGWEYYSALDLNSRAAPYPGKRPYPNPLDGGDATVDHDGDGLGQRDEYNAWVRYGNHRLLTPDETNLSRLLYSDGEQVSFREPASVLAAKPWLDINRDGVLSDDERDVDNDGLSNWVELHGPGTAAWWTKIWKDEKPYTVAYPELDWLDPDTDGDGIPDGQDDQDHDDVTNIQETVGDRAVPASDFFGLRARDVWIQPYNPCLPNYRSRSCAKHPPPPDESFPPFDTKTASPLPQLPYGGDTEPALHWPIDWAGASSGA
jgi:hypothetical protein